MPHDDGQADRAQTGRRTRRRPIALGLAGVAALALAAVALIGGREMQSAAERQDARSQVVTTRHGPVEFATWGDGPAVLAVHGAGGGHDQARLLAEALGGEGWRWIAPSRFGYLRSPLPADGSTAAQADAFADLLDALGVERVAILAMSGGVPPALQFAQRHPHRTAALVLLSSAPYAPLPAQPLPVPAWVYQALFGFDLPFWIAQKLAPGRLDALFDVAAGARAAASPPEREFVARMVDAFHPVSRRADGLRNEAAAIDPRSTCLLEAIAAPTLVVHARDDGINPLAIGMHTAARIAGAELLILPAGGHLLLGHHAVVRQRVDAFLHQHASDRQPASPTR